MPDQVIKIVIDADAQNAVAQIRSIASELKKMGDTSASVSTKTIAAGTAIGGMLKDLGEKAFALAKDFLDSFQELGQNVYQLQLAMGGTAESMSQLSFIGSVVGVSTDQMTRAFMFASTHLAKNDDAAKRLGVSYKDLQGNIKTAPQLFMELADKINSIRDPFLRAAAAKEMFGRGVLGILPMLGLGSEGMKRLAKDADALGYSLSQKDIQATRNFNANLAEMKGAVQGVANDLGRMLVPALGWVFERLKNVVQWVRNFFETWDSHSTVMKVVSIALGAVATALVALAVILPVVTAATWAWNAALDADPIVWILALIIGLGAGFIALVKNFEPVQQAVVDVSYAFGVVLGKGISIALELLRHFADAVLAAATTVLRALAMMTGAMSGGWLSAVSPAFAALDAVLPDPATLNATADALDKFHSKIDTTMTGWATTAWNQGGTIGRNFGKGLVEAIKNLKMPTMKDLLGGSDGGGYGADFLPDYSKGGGGGGGGGKSKIVDFWEQLVKNAYQYLDALKKAAQDAVKRMEDLKKSIRDGLRAAFDFTDLAGATFAQYLGPQALITGYQKRIAEMKQFVADIRELIRMGLPKDMLLSMVQAGVTKAGATAHMLVQHPEAMNELQKLQQEITIETAKAGELVGAEAMMPEVRAAESAAVGFQSTYARWLGYAKSHGYKPTAEETQAATTNIHNEIIMNNSMGGLSVDEVEQAVAWALKTGTTIGMSHGKKRTSNSKPGGGNGNGGSGGKKNDHTVAGGNRYT